MSDVSVPSIPTATADTDTAPDARQAPETHAADAYSYSAGQHFGMTRAVSASAEQCVLSCREHD